MSLENYTTSVEVQFSGNAKTYHYLANPNQWVACKDALEAAREIRVVTPGKVKDDRLAVSVATVLSTQASAHPDAVLPIVSVVETHGLDVAKAAVLRAESKATALANVQGVAA